MFRSEFGMVTWQSAPLLSTKSQPPHWGTADVGAWRMIFFVFCA